MLINENNLIIYQRGCVMSDIAIIAALIKSTLLEIGKQQQALGEGLLGVAPGERAGVPNNSVQYLLVGSEYQLKIAERCNEFIPTSMHRNRKED